MINIAIVGSSESHWTPDQKLKAMVAIKKILLYYNINEIILISGGCPKGGVDIYVETIVDSLRINKKIYKPEVNQWNDYVSQGIHKKGYMSRNIQIASACDILYCIDPKGRHDGGGIWTLNYAKKLNKEVHHVVIS